MKGELVFSQPVLLSSKISGKLANNQIFGQTVINPKQVKLLISLEFPETCPTGLHIQNRKPKAMQILNSGRISWHSPTKLIHMPETKILIPTRFFIVLGRYKRSCVNSA